MPDDTKRTDDERWAWARAVLDKVDDEGVRFEQRRIKRRFLGLFAGLMVFVFMLGLVLALVLVHLHPDKSSDDRDTASTAQELLGLGVIVAGLVVGAVGLVKVKGPAKWGDRWNVPTALLTRAQRKDLAHQIRGKIPVDQQHLALSRDLAERIVRTRWLVLTLVGFVVMQAGSAIQDPAWWRLAFFAGMAVLLVVATISTLRFASPAQRFLIANPA